MMGLRSDGTSGPPGEVPELVLDVRAASVPKARPKPEDPESPLELAIDARMLVEERAQGTHQGSLVAAPLADPGSPVDISFDARLLADYGEPPNHPLLSPIYAYRVLKRRRELRAALAGRREEAARAADEAADALLALAERARAALEKTPEYTRAFAELRDAEELHRSRDRVLVAEQDAQHARLSQVGARLSNLEADLAQAHTSERALALELSEVQGALAREEAGLKRAEMELRAARQRLGEREAAR
jgi:hypothetical protein